jgi:chloramphenicol-sensitive protein RarD
MSDSTGNAIQETPEQQLRTGLLAAFGAYGIWGIMPVYFVLVREVPAFEVLAHRIVWAIPFGALILAVRGQWPEVRTALMHRRMLLLLSLSALCIAGNWFGYITAIQTEQIFQASLGYYINPLLFALAGVLLLGERLRRLQAAAVLLAAVGVLILTFSGGQFPYIAIFLGISFTIYGIIRKRVVIGGMPGLFVETVLLLPFALGWLAWLGSHHDTVFWLDGAGISFILTLSGPITVVPLLFFAVAARRLSLTTVGMMQFIAPTLQFLFAVHYGEALTVAHLVCFACIWTAVGLFSWDAWRQSSSARTRG